MTQRLARGTILERKGKVSLCTSQAALSGDSPGDGGINRDNGCEGGWC